MTSKLFPLKALLILGLFTLPALPQKGFGETQKKSGAAFIIGDNMMPRHIKGIRLPKKFLRGIYLDSAHGTRLEFVKKIIPQAKEAGINCFVVDVAPYKSMKPKINPSVIQELKAAGIFTIARVVAFQYGLEQKTVEESHLQAIDRLVDLSLEAGFEESAGLYPLC